MSIAIFRLEQIYISWIAHYLNSKPRNHSYKQQFVSWCFEPHRVISGLTSTATKMMNWYGTGLFSNQAAQRPSRQDTEENLRVWCGCWTCFCAQWISHRDQFSTSKGATLTVKLWGAYDNSLLFQYLLSLSGKSGRLARVKIKQLQEYPFLPVCSVFSCVQTMVWVPVFGIFNARTNVDACDCNRRLSNTVSK